MIFDDAKDTWLTIFKIDGTDINGLSLDVLPIPDGEFGDKNTSTYQTGKYSRTGKNQYDGGTVDLSGLLIAGDAGQNRLEEALGDNKHHIFQVILTESGLIYEYDALVMQFKPDAEDNTAMFVGSLKADGPLRKTTTGASISKIEITTGTVIPTTVETSVASTVTDIVVNEVSATASETIKVTAATASFIGYSLDNGYSWTELTSGTMSGGITLGAANTITRILLAVQEDDKATRFINIWVARA